MTSQHERNATVHRVSILQKCDYDRAWEEYHIDKKEVSILQKCDYDVLKSLTSLLMFCFNSTKVRL